MRQCFFQTPAHIAWDALENARIAFESHLDNKPARPEKAWDDELLKRHAAVKQAEQNTRGLPVLANFERFEKVRCYRLTPKGKQYLQELKNDAGTK